MLKSDAWSQQKVAVLGASRGLGKRLVQELTETGAQVLSISRHSSNVAADFTKAKDQELVFTKLEEFYPHVIIYVAGGGPFGNFAERPWHSHEWALQLNLLFPAKLLHWTLNSTCSQICFVGSAVAEDRADPGAASYAGAKSGLKGLLTSVIAETGSKARTCDIRLFSPGYMDTEMLPSGSWPRQQLEKNLWQVDEVAGKLLSWLGAPAEQWHLRQSIWKD